MAARRGGGATGIGMGVWLGLAAIVILLDQITKVLIVGSFQTGETRRVTDFFNLVLAYNPGAAFSFLSEASGWQRWFFVGLGLVASGVIVTMIHKHPAQKLFCLAVSLILGGALGNVIDRVLRGAVVDFLQFHFSLLAPIFPGGFFPSFNIADSAITLGVICVLLDEILRVRRS